MEFFSKLGETLSDVGKDVAQKSKELTGIAKLRLDIKAKEDHIRKLYAQIGKKYYELHKEDVEPLFDELALITEAEEQISSMESEISELKGLKQCSECGEPMMEDAQFCQKCGMKYESVYEEES